MNIRLRVYKICSEYLSCVSFVWLSYINLVWCYIMSIVHRGREHKHDGTQVLKVSFSPVFVVTVCLMLYSNCYGVIE